MDTYSLSCAQLQVSETFVLDQEDPEVYSKEDRMGYNPARTWPAEPLPTEPEVEAAPAIHPEVIKKALAVHHMTADWLKSIGVDSCKEYANQSVESSSRSCCILMIKFVIYVRRSVMIPRD